MYTGKIRTIVKNHRFDYEMEWIQKNVKRADEFLEGRASATISDFGLTSVFLTSGRLGAQGEIGRKKGHLISGQ